MTQEEVKKTEEVKTLADEDKKSEKVAKGMTKVLAIIGLIGLLSGAAWLSVQAFRAVPKIVSEVKSGGAAVTLSSLFSRGEDELSITLGKTVVNSQEPLEISIDQSKGGEKYTVAFECKENASFIVEGLQSGSASTTCNTPLTFTAATGSLMVTPTTESVRYLDVYAVITKIGEDDKVGASDTALFTIVNNGATSNTAQATSTAATSTGGVAAATKPAPKTPEVTLPTPVAKPAPAKPAAPQPKPASQTAAVASAPVRVLPTGPTDLAVTIKGTGVALGNNEFFPTSEIPTNTRGAVRFVIENKGGVSSGPWGFIANLPIEGDEDYKYTAPLQKALEPGEKAEFVLGFDGILEEKQGVIKITLVPSATENTSNNVAQTVVAIKNK